MQILFRYMFPNIVGRGKSTVCNNAAHIHCQIKITGYQHLPLQFLYRPTIFSCFYS